MVKILPIILAAIGTGAGVGAGIALRPPAEEASAREIPAEAAQNKSAQPASQLQEEPAVEYVKLNNQFVVSVVSDGDISALVVMSLSVEVLAGNKEIVFTKEPKLRDVFLQVLFEHANAGGFQGDFTSSEKMLILRNALLEIAQRTLGPVVSDVLIQDLVRQDI